jgi:hypothetical protein
VKQNAFPPIARLWAVDVPQSLGPVVAFLPHPPRCSAEGCEGVCKIEEDAHYGGLSLNTRKMGGAGLEPSHKTPGETDGHDTGGAECGALVEDSTPNDARLTQVIEAWDNMPEGVRVAILAMVEAVAPSEPEQD